METSWDAFIKQNNMTELDMTGLLIKLANFGVTGIKVAYEGAGDSGAIEWIGYTTEPCELPSDVDGEVVAWHSRTLADLDTGAYALIESFAENTLLDNIEDWWNNDGGWGELSICIPSGEYMISNNVRVMHSDNYVHDGNLFKSIK